MESLYDLSYSAIVELCISLEQPKYRPQQIWEGIYKNYHLAISDHVQLPRLLRESINSVINCSPLIVAKELISKDKKSVKTLFRLSDGRNIEAVLMLYDRRQTLCISTQVGCAMGCSFCATGQMGYIRNLTLGEIIAQIMYFANYLKINSLSVTNIVFMGMGEPFHNYENTLAAIRRINDPSGYCFGQRRITISTVGIVPAIRRFMSERLQVNLAISLHSVDESTRKELLPISKKYPVDELLAVCKEYVDTTKRRITFEWALIQDLNDSTQQATMLARKIKGMLSHVNLIPLNPTKGFPHTGSSQIRAIEFRDVLLNHGISCTLRVKRGVEISAGCGQLADSIII
jgi:23S rRNA (adenine2503-C2)-methyltransferase